MKDAKVDLAAAILRVIGPFPASGRQIMITHWEYTVLKLPTEHAFLSGTDFDAGLLHEQLNALGAQGWELVSIFDIEKLKGGSKFVMAVLKRAKG